MNHETRTVSRRSRRKGRSALTVAVLLAGCLASGVGPSAASTPAASTPAARAGAAPSAASGWTTVFRDGFAGPAGSRPAAAHWFYDIGTGYGTGEIEQTTRSTRNVHLDGHGHLDITAIRKAGGWTSGRIESTRDDFKAPAGGQLKMTASIRQPAPANGLGYWPAFWALGSPMRAGGGWPASGEIDMMEDVNGLNEASQTLHDAAGSSGHPLTTCPGGSGCESGYHTYSVIINRVSTSAEYMKFVMDGAVEDTITEASVGTAAWQQAIDHGFFIIFDLAMGGNYPDGECGCTTPAAATSSRASMSVASVTVQEKGGNSTPTAKPIASGRVTGIGGLCLANQNSLNTEGNPMRVGSCGDVAGQRWARYSDKTLRTEGGCLDVAGAGTTGGTAVDWYPCNGTVAQIWQHESSGELVNPNSRLCLTDPGNTTGSALDIETCTGATGQLWTLPARAAVAGADGYGGFPSAFWGHPSKIPSAPGAIEFDFINATNGKYANRKVYWDVNGVEKSIAQSRYYTMPSCTACRINFYLGSPASRYHDFIELNSSGTTINADTSRVDAFGLPLVVHLHNSDNTDTVVGEDYQVFSEGRSSLFRQFKSSVPAPFKQLATVGAPYSIPAPGDAAAFQPGGADAGYMVPYAASVGATETTQQVFGCAGGGSPDLSGDATLCAGLNRCVAQFPPGVQNTPADYYKNPPCNYYAKFWHSVAVRHLQYGFAYDDVNGQSSDFSSGDAKYVQIAIGW